MPGSGPSLRTAVRTPAPEPEPVEAEGSHFRDRGASQKVTAIPSPRRLPSGPSWCGQTLLLCTSCGGGSPSLPSDVDPLSGHWE